VGSAAKVDGDCGCALPPSLYLTAAPSWFATPFGAPPWPPVGPDVGGSVNKIPAQLCYENTVGKGLQFDGTACYGP
jgi:hypothetical protein